MDTYNILSFNHSVEIVEKIESAKLLRHLDVYDKIVLLCDSNSAKYCLSHITKAFPGLDNRPLLVLPHGEVSKSMDSVQYILRQLIAFNASKNSVLLNIGGGMIGDLGGFAASIYKRGLRSINIPTTLLSMVDASVGGKTAIDFGGIKNSVGSFHFPDKVIVWPGFIHSLPKRQLNCGLAEMLKHAVLEGGKVYNDFLNCAPGWLPGASEIAGSIEIKNRFVLKDPFDKKERMGLNLGHSIGHAIEAWSEMNKSNSLLHGEAVAAGLIAELFLSSKLMGFSESELIRCQNWIKRHKLVPSIGAINSEDLLPFALHDKKNRDEHILISLIKSPGSLPQIVEVTADDYQIAVKYMIKLLSEDA